MAKNQVVLYKPKGLIQHIKYRFWLVYFILKSKTTPKWIKATLYGALAYFISWIDFIPDLAVGIGYVDDIGVILMALFASSFYINDDIRQLAANKINRPLPKSEQ